MLDVANEDDFIVIEIYVISLRGCRIHRLDTIDILFSSITIKDASD